LLETNTSLLQKSVNTGPKKF